MKLICYMLLFVSFMFSVSYAQDKAATVDLDQPRPYILQLMSVEVYPKKMDGKRWDPLGASGPDLFVQVFVDGHQVLLSKVRKDSFASEWKYLVSNAFALNNKSSVRIVVWDKDLKDDDLVGEPSFSPTIKDVKEGKTFRLAGGRVKEVKIRLFENSKIKKDSNKANTPKADTPKAETPKAETPKAETPKAETPKAETPKAETPKAETPKAETPKTETPKTETPKADTPKAESL
jgi:hypothetical protein